MIEDKERGQRRAENKSAEEINTRAFRWFREFDSIGGKRSGRNEKSDITYVSICT